MEKEGMPREEAYSKIYMMDSRGLIVKSRTDLTVHKVHFAKDMPGTKSLEEVVKTVKPTALIGAAATPNMFTKPIVEEMTRNNEKPVRDRGSGYLIT